MVFFSPRQMLPLAVPLHTTRRARYSGVEDGHKARAESSSGALHVEYALVTGSVKPSERYRCRPDSGENPTIPLAGYA